MNQQLWETEFKGDMPAGITYQEFRHKRMRSHITAKIKQSTELVGLMVKTRSMASYVAQERNILAGLIHDKIKLEKEGVDDD